MAGFKTFSANQGGDNRGLLSRDSHSEHFEPDQYRESDLP